MALQYINELLGLPELQLQQIVSMDTQEVHLEARLGLQTTLPHSRAFCIQTVEQALGYKSSSSRKRVAFQAGLARSSR